MGKRAIDAIDAIVVKGQPKASVTGGPYLFLDAYVVDQNNVRQFL